MRLFLLSLATSESLPCTISFTVAIELRFPKACTRFLSSVLVLPNTLQWFCLTKNVLQSGDAWLDCAHFGGMDLYQLDGNIPSSI